MVSGPMSNWFVSVSMAVLYGPVQVRTKFGIGPYIIAGGLVYVTDDHGLLTMAAARSTEYTQLGEAKVLEGPDSWGPMAIASGRLILRDLTRMICLDVSQR